VIRLDTADRHARMGGMQRPNSDRPRSRVRGLVRGLMLVMVILGIGLHSVAAWMFASWVHDEFLLPALPGNTADGAVMSISGDRVTIRTFPNADDDLAAPGVVGFAAGLDYLRLGEVVEVSGSDVTRTFESARGSVPGLGVSGSIDPTGDDPVRLREELGVVESSYEGPLGTMDAWLIEGSSTWVIHVHDRASGLDQSLRMMSILRGEGFSQLAVTYRNDPRQPSDDPGLRTFGIGERDDLAAAIAHARQAGATTVFLVGYGSGGALALAELYRDTSVAGVILDGPILDAKATVSHAASSAGGLIGLVPATVHEMGAVLVSLRYGITWEAADYLRRAHQITVPVLVLHGSEDADHPIADSRTLAESYPDVVKLVEIEGAGADRTWNVDPDVYGSAVLDFFDHARSGR
jgi:uncharacterized protein